MRKPIKAYLITDPALYPKSPLDFFNFYQNILQRHTIHFAMYRDKQAVYDTALMRVFLELNRAFGVLSLLNANMDLAQKLNFDGVHCNGSQMESIQDCKRRFRYVFFSAHSLETLKRANQFGANGITISPIFPTPNKGTPLGIEFLKQIYPSNYQAEIFALGGIISETHRAQLLQSPIQNFASIRYFLP